MVCWRFEVREIFCAVFWGWWNAAPFYGDVPVELSIEKDAPKSLLILFTIRKLV